MYDLSIDSIESVGQWILEESNTKLLDVKVSGYAFWNWPFPLAHCSLSANFKDTQQSTNPRIHRSIHPSMTSFLCPKTSGPRIRGVLLDLSGTLIYHDSSGKAAAIPGAVDAIAKLMSHSHVDYHHQSIDDDDDNRSNQPNSIRSKRKNALRIRILTNTSTVSSQGLHQQLVSLGFTTIPLHHIYTSVLAMRDYLLRHKLRPLCLLEDTHDFQSVGIPLEPPYNAVVVGLAPSQLNYSNLNQAYQILQSYPQNLLAMHRGCYIRKKQNTTSTCDTNKDPKECIESLNLGPGPFVTLLEDAIRRTLPELRTDTFMTTIVGKPSTAFYESAMNCWKDEEDISPSEICMVGDDWVGDIEGAQSVGIGTTIWVQTGNHPVSSLEITSQTSNTNVNLSNSNNDTVAPKVVVVPSIVEAVDYILSQYDDHDESQP
jgi:ribonucleotide monophosphatase NagD (HAD superfamily)